MRHPDINEAGHFNAAQFVAEQRGDRPVCLVRQPAQGGAGVARVIDDQRVSAIWSSSRTIGRSNRWDSQTAGTNPPRGLP